MPHYSAPAQAYYMKKLNQARIGRKRRLLDENFAFRARLFGSSEEHISVSPTAITALQPLKVRVRILENNMREESVPCKNDGLRFQQPFFTHVVF